MKGILSFTERYMQFDAIPCPENDFIVSIDYYNFLERSTDRVSSNDWILRYLRSQYFETCQ